MNGVANRARELLQRDFSPAGRAKLHAGQSVVVTTASALNAIEAALSASTVWLPIAQAPQDGTRLMLWDSVSKRPVFGSLRGDNPAITHFAAEPAGPEVG
ncbi:hypothetical protein [Stenotrophomonas maltophilia]|uniref:hypothetical protein n=1 Tax=Stenotrophomonas maltophilia TaxID=40324 RepID=UPI0011B73FD8|nr:hypothetical protein [Stenotrophomonas maltophilia]